MFAETPEPPYWAVIFTSLRTDGDHGYDEMAARMETLAAAQPGYLGLESVRGTGGTGITVSYWSSEAAVRAWKGVAAHAEAQRLGREKWYAAFRTRVCKVERDSSFPR